MQWLLSEQCHLESWRNSGLPRRNLNCPHPWPEIYQAIRGVTIARKPEQSSPFPLHWPNPTLAWREARDLKSQREAPCLTPDGWEQQFSDFPRFTSLRSLRMNVCEEQQNGTPRVHCHLRGPHRISNPDLCSKSSVISGRSPCLSSLHQEPALFCTFEKDFS